MNILNPYVSLFILALFFPFSSAFSWSFSIVSISLITLFILVSFVKISFISIVLFSFLILFFNLSFFNNILYLSGDLFDPLKSFLYTSLMILFSSDRNNYSINYLPRLVLICILIQLILVFFINVNSAFESAVSLFFDQSKNHFTMEIESKNRGVGTLMNPNYLGFFGVLMLIFSIRYSKLSQYGIFFMILSFFLILLSGSRTAIVVSIIAFIVLMLKDRRNFKATFLAFSFVLLSIFGIFLGLSYVPRMSILFSYEAFVTSQSWATRIEVWQSVFGYLMDRPFLGHFIQPISIADNQLVISALRFGIPFTILFYIFLPFMFLRSRDSGFVFFIALQLFFLTGAFFDNPKLLVIFFSFIWLHDAFFRNYQTYLK